MQLNYNLIGSQPHVEVLRLALPELMNNYQRRNAAITEHTPREDRFLVSDLAVQIEDCAAHFYGLDAAEFSTVDDLISAVRGLDQALEF